MIPMPVENDFDIEKVEMTDKEFIVDDEGIPLDSDFRAFSAPRMGYSVMKGENVTGKQRKIKVLC